MFKLTINICDYVDAYAEPTSGGGHAWFSRQLLHSKPYQFVAFAAVLVGLFAIGGLAMAGPVAHNYNLNAVYNVDTSVLTVTSKYGNFESVSDYWADVYDRDDFNPPHYDSLRDSATISGNTITKTLSGNASKKASSDEPGILFVHNWAKSQDGQWVPIGDNSITKVYNPPKIINGTYDSSTRTVTLTTDKAIAQTHAPSICHVYNLKTSLSVVSWPRCADTASISSNGTTITATVPGELLLQAVVVGSSLEVWHHAVKSTHGDWNTQTYHKSLD